MTQSSKPPFTLQVGYDQTELLGGRWWQDRLQVAANMAARRAHGGRATPSSHLGGDMTRRSALQGLIALGGIAMAGTMVTAAMCSGRSTRTSFVEISSLEAQQARGLLAGGAGQPFAWPSAVEADHTGQPLDRSALLQQATELRPQDPAWQPMFVPTLFQAVAAPDSKTLLDGFRLVHTQAMARCFAQGEAVRDLLQMAERPQEWALVVDLPGPEAVAFAAALAKSTTIVFTFGNWPHPQGVVPAHLNLSACAYYRAELAQKPPDGRRPAALVLDRNRLNPYANEANRFDNRYQARLPTAAQLQQNGVTRLMYVVPEDAPERELDDLNERFVEYRAAGIEVKMLGLRDLLPDPKEAPKPVATGTTGISSYAVPHYYWHGSPGYHGWFWNHYGWASRPHRVPAERPPMSSFGSGWTPARRDTSLAGLSRLGRTTTEGSSRSGSGGSGSRSPGGSWGRSSGGSSGS